MIDRISSRLKYICVICGKEFENPKANQQTCGKKDCTKKYQVFLSAVNNSKVKLQIQDTNVRRIQNENKTRISKSKRTKT